MGSRRVSPRANEPVVLLCQTFETAKLDLTKLIPTLSRGV
jgi:hypothetical protein